MRTCAKSWEITKKIEKVWENVLKVEKEWESLLEVKKARKCRQKDEKVW